MLVLHTVVFVLVIVVLGRVRLSSSRRQKWLLASQVCAQKSPEYGVITPVLYPSWVAAIFAVSGMLRFWAQVSKGFFKRKHLFRALMFVWVLLIGLVTADMVTGLIMIWRQRHYLRSVARDEFEDDVWGLGQVAALFI